MTRTERRGRRIRRIRHLSAMQHRSNTHQPSRTFVERYANRRTTNMAGARRRATPARLVLLRRNPRMLNFASSPRRTADLKPKGQFRTRGCRALSYASPASACRKYRMSHRFCSSAPSRRFAMRATSSARANATARQSAGRPATRPLLRSAAPAARSAYCGRLAPVSQPANGDRSRGRALWRSTTLLFVRLSGSWRLC